MPAMILDLEEGWIVRSRKGTLRGSPKGKTEKEQYLPAVDLDYYDHVKILKSKVLLFCTFNGFGKPFKLENC